MFAFINSALFFTDLIDLAPVIDAEEECGNASTSQDPQEEKVDRQRG